MKKLIVGLMALALLASPAMGQVNAPFPYKASGLTNSAVTVKASKGTLQWASCYNPSNAVAYVQVFDIAGSVTLGSSVPKLSLAIASGANLPITGPATFINAIKVAATTTAGGSTAPSTALDCNFGFN